MRAILVKLFFDKADVAAAFHAGEPDLGKIVDVCAQAHVLFQIMHGYMVVPHHREITFAITHNDIGLAFYQDPKSM